MEASQTNNKDYYQLLGISRGATREEIKRAYREIALVYHPDSNFFSEIIDERINKEQTEMFKYITSAYHTLINATSRAAYDRTLGPELPKWKGTPTSSDEHFRDTVFRSKGMRSSGSFGRFGSAPQHPQSAFDDPEIQAQIRPVSELIRRPRRSLISKISALFGL